MNKWEKEVLESLLGSEEEAIKELERQYSKALKDINDKVKAFQADIDLLDTALQEEGLDDNTKALLKSQKQSKIYQQNYQQALSGQVSGILDKMHGDNYSTIDKYLNGCYETGYVGTMYNIAKQGIPIIAPIDQASIVKAVLTDSKVSKGLYNALGVDVSKLKKSISQEISRGIASGLPYRDIARNISNVSGAPLSRAKTIARTEGHRIQQTATSDAQYAAKAKGADVVKQWDATLDGNTRESHARVDGEIRELDEKFSNGLKFPGDPSGGAAEVVNCRCAMLTRARWALDESELETLKERAAYFGLDKTDNFDDYKQKYLPAAEEVSQQATISPVYSGIINSGGKVKTVGGIDCAIETKDYGFTDGTAGGIKKTVPATIYTTPDGTQFIYPKSYNKKNQTLTPDDAIATWYRVPENVRTKIQKTIEVVDYYNPQDSHWQKIYKNFTHSYAVGGDKITIFRSNYHNLDYLTHTYCHEGGHYIDYTLPGTSRSDRYCNQADWQDAMAKDLQSSGKKSWRAYGENSALEDFADSVGYYILDHNNFVATFPERSKLLANILK